MARVMGLQWIRLETVFHQNHKILYLVEDNEWRAIVNWAAGLAHAGAQGTDGYLPRACLPLLHARRRDADALSAAGLWIPTDGGWVIHDWAEHQPSNDETHARRERARAAALARWHGNGNGAAPRAGTDD